MPRRLGPLHLHVCVSQLTQVAGGCFPHQALLVFGCPCWHLGTWISVPDSGGSLVLHCANNVVLWEQLLSFWGPELLGLVGRGVLWDQSPIKTPGHWVSELLWFARGHDSWGSNEAQPVIHPTAFLPFVDCAVFCNCNKSSLWPRP